MSSPERDMSRDVRTSNFFLPIEESANGARRNPPAREPMKNDDAGRPARKEPAHWRDHSDMVDAYGGKSQDHASFGREQMLLLLQL